MMRMVKRSSLAAGLALMMGLALAQGPEGGGAPGGPSGGMRRGSGGFGRMPRPFGVVESINETTITLKGVGGAPASSVGLAPGATITKLEKATADDLKSEQWVTAMIGGSRDNPEAHTARNITIYAEKPAAQPTPSPGQGARRPFMNLEVGKGTIAGGVLTLKVDDATTTAEVGENARIYKGTPGKLGDVKAGDSVRVWVNNSGGTWVGSSISIYPPGDMPMGGRGMGGGRRGVEGGAAGGPGTGGNLPAPSGAGAEK